METVRMLIPIIVAHVCVLAVVIVVIRRLLLNDTMQAVERIKQVETEVRKKEEAIRKEIEEHEQEFARKKAEAEDELQRHKEEAEKEVARVRDQIVTDAKKEGDRILAQAKKNEQSFRQQIAQGMEEKAVDYAAEVFKLVCSERITAALNEHFVDELLNAIEEVDAGTISIEGGSPDIRSSQPLAPEQKRRIESLLLEKFNLQIAVNETVQPDLLAGLVLKLGSLEIDGSLKTRCQEAAVEVKKHVNIDAA